MSPLLDALEIRAAIAELGLDIYQPLDQYPEAVYSPAELQVLLQREIIGRRFPGEQKTRSKLANQAVCAALGYEAPEAFRRVKPKLPAQDLDIYTQKQNNLQIYNEAINPTRRYAIIRLTSADVACAVRVIEGIELAPMDRTGTVTSKYQAARLAGAPDTELVSAHDTPDFAAEFEPADDLPAARLKELQPSDPPVHGRVLSVRGVHARLITLLGTELQYSASERVRGDQLHRIVSAALGLRNHADTGRFPDIVCQSLEVKLQTSRTIDLGLISPDSRAPAFTLSPVLRHRDARYVVAYASRHNDTLTIDGIVTSTGADFFNAFRRFGGLTQNRKLQLRLPADFFDAE